MAAVPADLIGGLPRNYSIDRLLEVHPFTKGMDQGHIHALARCARNHTVLAGEYLWRQGDQAEGLFLIQSGDVALEIWIPNEGPLSVETIHAGEIVGGSWLGPPHHWQFDARVLTALQAVVINGECIEKACEQDGALGYELLKRFALVIGARLQRTRLRLLDLYKLNPGAGRISST